MGRLTLGFLQIKSTPCTHLEPNTQMTLKYWHSNARAKDSAEEILATDPPKYDAKPAVWNPLLETRNL